VEEVRPRRRHQHDADGAERQDGERPDAPVARGPRLAGRNREHKLVHFDGPAELVGQLVDVIIERAGPYALVGRAAGEGHHG
jgi:tRNA A37 methylthiotransferase MiaB